MKQQSFLQKQPLSTMYTIFPLTDPDHQKKLKQYMSLPPHPKTSFCRFYLRGICILKPQKCRFAHNFQQLVLEQDQQQLIRDCNYTQKQRKKKYFQQRLDFQQKALFILKNVQYQILYDYQFTQKWKTNTNEKAKHIYTLEDIKTDRSIRLRIREVLHRQNWGKLIDFLVNKFKGVDFPICFLSKWFSKVGFEKPQTRCKFGDFMRYMIFVKNFKQVNIIVPPRVQKAVYFVNCHPNIQQQYKTLMYQNIQQIQQQHTKAKLQYKQQLLLRLQPLPIQHHKKFICRYFMAGNCQFQQNQCNYCHSIVKLSQKYSIQQKFQSQHKQIVKGKQQRLNYVSLYNYSYKNIDHKITLQQLNGNANIRQQYRKIMHRELYKDFLILLMKLTKNQQQRLPLSFIQKSYNNAGFNHSEENKFGQFETALWDLGYLIEDVKFQNQNHKTKYVFKIPSIQHLDQYFKNLINQILYEEVATLNLGQKLKQKQKNIQKINNEQQKQYNRQQQQQDQTNITNFLQTQDKSQQQKQQSPQPQPLKLILQSSFRKKLYQFQQPFSTPLHIYLKLKFLSLQQTLKLHINDKSLLSHIFFQTNQQNYKKLVQICKSYFKSKKDYIHKLQQIQLYIKNLHKDQINLNGFVNFKNLLQSAVLDAGKKLYVLSFNNNILVVDKANLCLHEKNFVKGKYMLKNYQNYHYYGEQQQQQKVQLQSHALYKQRIVIIDNQQSFLYSQRFLSKCNKLGVDLQGRLRKQGYIDLIQISGILNNKKQIFVYDIFVVKKQQNKQLYERIRLFIKYLFEDYSRVKILHDCRQDSMALKYLMGIQLKHVFDTSGMNIILQQKQHYISYNKKQQSYHNLLKKIYQVKTPSLNTILDKWQAPNGVNIFKQQMKKLFNTQGTRYYFQSRPIDQEFLEYSVQDVEDLINVYERMKEEDMEKVSEVIGEMYAGVWEGC